MKNVIKLISLLTLALVNPILAFCQNENGNSIEVKGVILEQENNKPLPYVNIGVLGKPVGTVSDINGNYILDINKIYLSDTLQISLVG